MPVSISDFHAHLDVCQQCENNPFDLCPVGSNILFQLKMGNMNENHH